jgi:hypothetical protein
MKILVARYNSAVEHTNSVIITDGIYDCFGLEDEHRTSKVYSETRIADGVYYLELRTEGGFHERYLSKYGPKFHKGMLWIKDVPNFEYVLIHIGNDDDDTAGCLLVGSSNSNGSNFIGASEKAYKKFYPKIADALLNGECVEIEFVTIDDPNK